MNESGFWTRGLFVGFLFCLLLIADVAFGSISIPLSTVLSSLFNPESSTFSDIIWQFRLPKAITCILAGSALATGGLMMQSLFRNPLAGPDVLGLSSGASLAVAIVILIGQSTGVGSILMGNWSVATAASIGGSIVLLIVIFISRFIKDNTSLLIIGLMISAATSSLVGILQFLSKAEDLQIFLIWSLGSVGSTHWGEVQVLAIITFIGLGIAFFLQKPLNAWLLGENYAANLGINTSHSRFWIVIATALLTGGVTAFCGPIAFVGLAVPHLVRLFIPTTNHKILLPFVMVTGASLLLFCDVVSNLAGGAQVLPLNAITSLIGAPLVISMVISNKQVRV
jgi:iron complex transport system permease protein